MDEVASENQYTWFHVVFKARITCINWWVGFGDPFSVVGSYLVIVSCCFQDLCVQFDNQLTIDQ